MYDTPDLDSVSVDDHKLTEVCKKLLQQQSFTTQNKLRQAWSISATPVSVNPLSRGFWLI
ncbi:arginine pathway regulatory protein ArgR [Vibrio variabilis]|uniref:Arginine pathway regulatory protein ArgR n=1 Tax=Vibrio variabilis TaxID=990271 RepID=A0ABQ0JEK5_9VIBR|nr:arginine pathway regulatory protein ArgR [Vibrio variabilis]